MITINPQIKSKASGGNELRKSKYWLGTQHDKPKDNKNLNFIALNYNYNNNNNNNNNNLLISPVSSDSISESTIESIISKNTVIGSPLNSKEDLIETIDLIKLRIFKIENKLTMNSFSIQIKFIEGLILKFSSKKWRKKTLVIDDDWRIILQCLSLLIDQFLLLERKKDNNGSVTIVIDLNKQKEEQEEEELNELLGTLKLEEEYQFPKNVPNVYKMPFHRLNNGITINPLIEEEEEEEVDDESSLNFRIIRSSRNGKK